MYVCMNPLFPFFPCENFMYSVPLSKTAVNRNISLDIVRKKVLKKIKDKEYSDICSVEAPKEKNSM